jgi:hypothetical protein
VTTVVDSFIILLCLAAFVVVLGGADELAIRVYRVIVFGRGA